MQIAPLFLSTLGVLIVGVAGSLNSLVPCYRGLPCPAEARPVLVLYHGASDAANGDAKWMRTSLRALYPLGFLRGSGSARDAMDMVLRCGGLCWAEWPFVLEARGLLADRQ